MRVRVTAGQITAGLVGAFITSLMVTLVMMIFQQPQPSAANLPAAAPVHHVVHTTAASNLDDAVMAKQAAALSVKAAAIQVTPSPKPSTSTPPPAPVVAPTTPAPQPAPVQTSSGVLSCAQVENLWISAGGRASAAVTMAEIAGAESSRNPGAPNGGLWQIQGGQPIAGDINDPTVNAENAVRKFEDSLSVNGNGFLPWTTYTSGLYLNHPC